MLRGEHALDLRRGSGLPVPLQRQDALSPTRAPLYEGSHGKGGGYRLLRSPADYTAGEILRAAEGTLACLGEDVQLTPAETASGVSEVYRRLDAQIRAALDAVTLSSLTAADAGDEYVI